MREVAVRRGEDAGQRRPRRGPSAHRGARRLRARARRCRARGGARPGRGSGATAAWPADRPAAPPRRGTTRARDVPAGQRRRPEGRGLRCRAVRRSSRGRRSCGALPCRRRATQLLPPKPNELLSATRTAPRAGSQLRSAGRTPASSVARVDGARHAGRSRSRAG